MSIRHFCCLQNRVSAIVSVATLSLFSTLPVEAATLAEATSAFSFENFTIEPLASDSSSSTSTITVGEGAIATATADAFFRSLPAVAANEISNVSFISDMAAGDSPKSALAESEASVVGDFVVEANSVFAFDFSGFIELLTFVESETALAAASSITQFSIFDISPKSLEATELDTLALLGEISTPEGFDNVDLVSSEAISIDTLTVIDSTDQEGTEEAIFLEVFGRYERSFDQPTTLTLIELKASSVFSKNKKSVPEPVSLFALFVGVGGTVISNSRRIAKHL